ncbi:TPA: hypothetical protein IAA82_04635, partial [Candidatus Galligastranaerophilus gallistercoris]|nr:hypothetical protein [Candidatus Galligastranaerophilus gallistercoris]
VLILIISVFFIYRFFESDNADILVEFQKMRPIKEKVNVYYNGFKVGRTAGLKPCDHSKNICSKVRLDKNLMILPKNIEIKLKQKKISDNKFEDYMEIQYPVSPDFETIKDGAIIKGEVASGFHNYLNEEVSYSDMEMIKQNLISATDNLNKASGILVDILSSIDDVASNSKQNSKLLISNLNKTVSNLSLLIGKIDNSLDDKVIRSIFYNVDDSTKNLNGTLENIRNFTYELNSGSGDITGTMHSLNSISRNIDEIVQGVNCTLQKPFGGLRLIFGAPVN